MFIASLISFFVFNFFLGILGVVLNRRNLLLVLLSIEILLLSVLFVFLFSSIYFDDLYGIIFSFFIVTIAACESSIGLSLLIVLFKNSHSIEIEEIVNLKG